VTVVHDPRTVLAARLQAAVAKAFGPEHAAVDPMVRRSERADFQADLAMGLAKVLKRPPRQVAEAVVAAAEFAGVCERVEIAGPGFINLTLVQSFLERRVAALALDARLGVPLAATKERVVVDYSAPNVAKEMHVGHLRTTVIGDALARLFEFAGHEVIRQNHIGDWGTPFGMLIEHLFDKEGTWGAQAADAGQGSAGQLDIGDFNTFYREARVKFDADPKFAERARQRVVMLQAGDAPTLERWRQLVGVSRRYFADIYERLGITLDDADVRGESAYNADLPDVAVELERRGIASINDGALCAFPPGFVNREGEPLPLIVRKQDGGYGYAATDLAALRYRTQTLHATRILYVVGSPQAQHLAMVFAVGALAGWLKPPARAEHVAFGSVLGADKKIFKTRAGDTVPLVALLDEAVERADTELLKRNREDEAVDRRKLAAVIGIGAIKFADLQNDRIKDYVFDWDRMLAAEGRTGPYLQYAHARIHSIFRKAAESGIARASNAAISLGDSIEHRLALELAEFGYAVIEAGEGLRPHRLCGYLYDLATAFTAFFEACPVLKAPDEATRASRLALCELTARVLKCGLGLLGIEAPERM
jgi:arginyl-tRNA synthetase